jgi:hypothetical protein
MKQGTKIWVGLAAVALLLTGCWQKSLEPFYTAKDLRSNPALVGTWIDSEEEEKEKAANWTFSESGKDVYRLEIIDQNEKLEFDARLFRFEGTDFLDLHSLKRGVSEIPAHHLLRVSIAKEQLEVSILSLDWVKNWVNVHPKSIAHIRVSDPDNSENPDKSEIVLTAKTAELQNFLKEHLNKEGFFDGSDKLKRKK